MTNQEKIEALEEIAFETGGEIHTDYSGRCMYGKLCYGISVEGGGLDVVEAAGAKGIRGAKMDNLGRGTIVYWPSIQGKAGKYDE